MATHNYKFGKQEHLCSNEEIKALFDKGHAFHEYPFSIVWQIEEAPTNSVGSRTAISVSKRKLRKAVQRNLAKRRIREAFRQNKWLLYDKLSELSLNIKFIVIYTPKEILPYQTLHQKMILVLNRFVAELTHFSEQQNKDSAPIVNNDASSES